jgi:hypothetical protein
LVVSHELGSLLHLAITVILSILFVRGRTIVVLPAILLSSIIGFNLGLSAHPFILGLVNLAIPLLVFVAGLELKPDLYARVS